MSDLAIVDRSAIADRIHLFFKLVDSGRASATTELFTEDAKLTFGPGSPNPGTISGGAIAAAMEAREAQTGAFTRHAVANIAYASANTDQAAVTYLLTLYRSDDETRSTLPAFVADVEEVWTKDALGWRLAARTILPAFARG